MTKRTLAYSHWEADSSRFDSTPQFFFFGVQYRLVEGSIWPKMGKAYADSQCQNNKKKTGIFSLLLSSETELSNIAQIA